MSTELYYIYQNISARIGHETWILLTIVIFILLLNRKRKSSKHKFKIKMAGRTLDKLKSIDVPAKQFGYLRKIDPYVFEEMILTAFSNRGHKIRRNKRYSGDGGIDGRVIIDGERVLIQAKRYSGYINASDVKQFSNICARQGVKGIFVHSGKTGKKSYDAVINSLGNIEIVSGGKLLDLLIGDAHV